MKIAFAIIQEMAAKVKAKMARICKFVLNHQCTIGSNTSESNSQESTLSSTRV